MWGGPVQRSRSRLSLHVSGKCPLGASGPTGGQDGGVRARRSQFAALALIATGLGGMVVALGLDGSAAGRAPTADPGPGTPAPSRSELANRCFALASATNDRFVAIDGGGYRAAASARPGAASFFLEPTGLGTYLLQDEAGTLLAAGDGNEVER